MFWLKEDGIAVAQMITLFALVSIITFSALPFYNSIITQTHKAKVMIMYNKINTYIIMSKIDSTSVKGINKVPFPNQITSNSIINSSDSTNWTDDGSGTWTYLPTGTQIIYRRIKQDDFSLIIHYRN